MQKYVILSSLYKKIYSIYFYPKGVFIQTKVIKWRQNAAKLWSSVIVFGLIYFHSITANNLIFDIKQILTSVIEELFSLHFWTYSVLSILLFWVLFAFYDKLFSGKDHVCFHENNSNWQRIELKFFFFLKSFAQNLSQQFGTSHTNIQFVAFGLYIRQCDLHCISHKHVAPILSFKRVSLDFPCWFTKS